ncbi:MAG: IS21 family transposase [Gemmatimonadales bacterium]
MSNRLKMALIETILTLAERKWSLRRIARELGIHRETVARHLAEARAAAQRASVTPATPEVADGSKPAKAPTGSATVAAQAKPAKAPTGSSHALPGDELPAGVPGDDPGGRSLCEPFRLVIGAKVELGLTAQRIFQDLVAEHGFAGRYPSVRRFVRRLLPQQELPFRRMECGPGEEAQVDFGQGAFIQEPDCRRYRPHVLRVVLSYSRKAYSEVVRRQTTEAFVRCLENAFWHFGGVPQRVVLDNLRAAVSRADWFDPEINPKVRSFAEHYGIALMPTRPCMPRHKGKVERGVDYVQENALKGRSFTSAAQQNAFLLDWEQTVADTRIHGTTRRQVGGLFREVERASLRRLPLERFPCFCEGQRKVHRDGHVEVERAYYSLPPEHLGRSVWVRWDGRLVRIFTERMELIATHVRQEAGRFSTQRQHLSERKINGIERGADWLLGKVRGLGPRCGQWAEAVLGERGVEGARVLQGLLALAGRHAVADLEQACAVALSHESYHLRTLRTLLERQEAARPEPAPFLEDHPLIRDLSAYEEFAQERRDKEVGS